MTVSDNMSSKEIRNDFKEIYSRVRLLLDEDSKHDPESEPYLSKYRAREILCSMNESLRKHNNNEKLFEGNHLEAMLGVVLLNIGIIDMETDELSSSDRILTEAMNLLEPYSIKPEIITILINVYNHLGILWTNQEQSEQAITYLFKAKEAYGAFKCTLLMPIPLNCLLSDTVEQNTDFMQLEKAHTLTLYYLAQVHGALKDNLKSAIYCHITLRRQLQYQDYEPIDWSLNSATLSQFFAERNGFYQSRHHLSAASTILKQYEETLEAAENNDDAQLAKLETFKHRSADVARCWAKYCILLMDASKNRLMNDSEDVLDTTTDLSNLTLEDEDSENICGGDLKSLIFPDLDVSEFESSITDKFLLMYQDAREVFLCCQMWLNKAKEYYKLDSLASDYIELIQDCSSSYSYLAFYEEDDERRAKMHKRRIDMLEELVKEINPTYYLQYCKQLWFELGEIYSDILSIKLDKMNKSKEKPTPHVLNKINMLCEKSIENYDSFLNSVKDKNGKMPAKLDNDVIKPVVSAHAFIGRNSMKRIAVDKNIQLLHVMKSFESFQSVVDICTADENAAIMMKEEFSLCQEMVQILPLKIKKIQSQMIG